MLIDNIIANADVTKQEYRIFLHKINGEIIREITKSSFNKVYSPKLGSTSEFSFSIPQQYDGEDTLNYDSVIGRNLIRIQQQNVDIGYFEIQNVATTNDGISEIKDVQCYSAEIKFINKHLYLTADVFKLINNADPTKGVLNTIVAISPSWSIGHIDDSLINLERYFDVTDTNIYDFMINTVQTTYECVFVFDTINKQINAYTFANFGAESPIIVSLDNIVNSAKIETVTNEIVTRLHLYGDGDLTVRGVNFGNDFIDNIAFFMTTDFMSQGLIDAMTSYNALVAANQAQYATLLSELSTYETQLIVEDGTMATLQAELTSLQAQLAYLQSISGDTSSVQASITSTLSQINSEQNIIDSLNNSITATNNSIDAMITLLDINNNLTSAQLKELDSFIIEDTYQDSAFIVDDTFTYSQTQAVEQQLLVQGGNVLQRVSYPRYRLTIDMIDFLKNIEFSYWWDKLFIGDKLRIAINQNFTTEVRVVGYTHDWDNNKLEILFGDKYQIDDANIRLVELIKNSLGTSTTVDFERYKYKDYVDNNKNEILTFINSSLDLNKNTVVGGTNQEITIDPTGFLARRFDQDLNQISPEQLKITNNAIVLSDDGFTTAKTAIGKLSNGMYGIAAEIIAGKMIVGNELQIQTSDGTFVIDGNGVTITSMSVNMTSSDGLRQIIINPNTGLKMSSRATTGGSFTDNLYFDANGTITAHALTVESDCVFKGALSAATGTFNGALVAASGTFGGDLQAAGGTFTGTLSGVDGNFTGTLSGATGTFSGTLSAGNIIGGTITGNTSITGATIDVTTDVSVGRGLIINNNGYTNSGIFWGNIDSTLNITANPSGTLFMNSAGGGSTVALTSNGDINLFGSRLLFNGSPVGGTAKFA
jgi:hypothetical protein